MAVVGSTDVATRLRRELTEAEEADALALIEGYQAELEELLGRSVEQRTFTETTTWPLTRDRYHVRRGPVASVSAVTIGGMAVTSTDYEVYRDSVEVSYWLATPGVLSVTYEGGFEDARAAKEAVLARVCRMMARHDDDDEGVDSSTVEGHSVKWTVDAFTAAELEACERLRAPDMAG